MSTSTADRGTEQGNERPVGIRSSTSYFPEVESLRGVAIALVVGVHLDFLLHSMIGPPVGTPAPGVSIWYAFIRAGATGVDLFFLLSGFLLSLPFFREAAGGPPVGLAQYFRRRALRIYPAYAVAVVAAAVLSAHEPRDLLRGIPYLFFLNAFPDGVTRLDPYSNVWWSLATEVHFYLLLPLLPLCLRSRTGRVLGVALLVAYALAYSAFDASVLRMPTYVGQRKLDQSVFGRAPLFLAGMLLAWVYQHAGERIRSRLRASPILRVGGADLLFMGAVVALGYLLRWTVALGWLRQDLPPYHAWHVLEAAAWAAVLFLLLMAPLCLRPLLCNRALGWLGIISYSLYLIHYPVFVQVVYRLSFPRVPGFSEWNLNTAGLAIGMTAVCLAASALTYRFIERPFLARKARIRG